MALQQGEIVGAYRIIAPLGQGGTGMVYRAHDARRNREVAIKLIRQPYPDTPEFLLYFEREAQILAALDHPHIVQVYGVGEHTGELVYAPYLVLGLVEGKTLKARMEQAPLSADEIIALFRPIASALDYAHRRGVLHRDIKPSNILIDADLIPYLTDFALPSLAVHETGTPQYAAPEQAAGGVTDHRADLYSLGVVLYELLVGELPFSGTPHGILNAHIRQQPPLPASINPAISPEVEDVLLRALSKAPAERYGSASELTEALCDAIQRARYADDESDTQPLEILPPRQQPTEPHTATAPSKRVPVRHNYWLWAAWVIVCGAAGGAAALIVSAAMAAPNP